MRREDEEGMVLVTVLLLVGIAAAALAIMLTSEDTALARATKLAGAAQAMAIARAGELSAVAALRRDMTVAPLSDDATEPWANIGERGAPIAGGRFALAIGDATGKIDLNPLARGDPITRLRLGQAEEGLRLGDGTANRITDWMIANGRIADLGDLAAAGLAPDVLARLASVATVLPVEQPINLNAAPEPVLALLLDDPIAARALAGRRARAGRLTPDDFALEHVRVPPRTGFVSALFWVRTRASSGAASQQLTSLLLRKARPGGGSVGPIARWPGSAPLQAPPLPEDAMR